ncbi:MAG: glycosyltransferase family 4 protein [Candidatus Pacearchaeota archaeon]
MKFCLITKNRFFIDENYFISSGWLGYEDLGLLGFKFNEFEKLIFIGFKEDMPFDGYKYNFGSKNGIFIVGSKWREEKRYVLDRLNNILNTLKEIWKNRKILKDVDLVFAPFFEYVVFEFLLLKIICKKAKLIVHLITDYPEWNYRKRKNLFIKYLLLFSLKLTQFISNENWILSKFLYQKYKNKKSIIVPTSSLRDYQIGISKFLPKEKINLIFVGRLEGEKQPHIPVLIVKNLIIKNQRNNFYLNIVGNGSLKNKLEELVIENNLKDNVNFWGWIKERDVLFEIYKQSDIFLLTSNMGEGLGWVILEAMSQGLPILSTKCGGPEEIIEDGKNGFLIEIKDENYIVDKFVEKIEYLINNSQVYEEISKNNIEKAKDWTAEKFFAIMRKNILELLNNE